MKQICNSPNRGSQAEVIQQKEDDGAVGVGESVVGEQCPGGRGGVPGAARGGSAGGGAHAPARGRGAAAQRHQQQRALPRRPARAARQLRARRRQRAQEAQRGPRRQPHLRRPALARLPQHLRVAELGAPTRSAHPHPAVRLDQPPARATTSRRAVQWHGPHGRRALSRALHTHVLVVVLGWEQRAV